MSTRPKFDLHGRDKHGQAKPKHGPWLPAFGALVRGAQRRSKRLYPGHLGQLAGDVLLLDRVLGHHAAGTIVARKRGNGLEFGFTRLPVLEIRFAA